MQLRFDRQSVLIFVALVAVCLSLADVNAQRRKKRSRRVTNPVTSRQTAVATPTPVPDARIISTAEDSANNAETSTEASDQSTDARATTTNRTRSRAADSDQDVRRNVNKLSRDLSRITEKVDKMEEAQRTIVFMDLLSRAEQRAENLRAQLRDVEEKEANLQARSLQLEIDIKPENIERAVAVNGSTRPEDAREQRRRQLENERVSMQSRLQQLTSSRARLESTIATTDQEIERLRARIDAFVNPQGANNTTSTNAIDEGANTNSSTTPTPTPIPLPMFR